MKALVIEGPNIVEIKDVEEPKIGPHDVLIKVKLVGIHPQDYYMTKDLTVQGHKISPIPHIPGEEVAGVVEKVGDQVKSLKKEDKVIIYHRIHDGTCDMCILGNEQLCRNGGRFGINANGGLAEYIAVPERNVIKIPEEISWEVAASLPASALTSYHALNKAGLRAGEYVVVFGASGNTGMFAVQLGKIFGGIVIAVSRKNRSWLKEFGADYLVSLDTVEEEVREISKGKMADVVIDSIGATTWNKSLKIVGTLGRWVTFGALTGGEFNEEFVKISPIYLYRFERTLIGVRGGKKSELYNLIKLASKLKIRVWRKFKLEEALKALEAVVSPERDGRVFVEV
ncbi:alcohol dehydrogenase catalytic domain-containing protein [Sulfolobus sp. E11-6]|uniref:alcohol dehydrogenase catalytic domain-containing protein n=1 Tax=Sulfolobus sp. E11-6 TaxID=2663020 RepID=UPI001296B0E1|nr:alcohol dehydrogenase catalytic domain-containing protein [Sulfolobus sp. E11-6]QGA68987.1 alcohol dehydrogenase catalytic domain-containing protein [Sulfolobus sp. E11-6]